MNAACGSQQLDCPAHHHVAYHVIPNFVATRFETRSRVACTLRLADTPSTTFFHHIYVSGLAQRAAHNKRSKNSPTTTINPHRSAS